MLRDSDPLPFLLPAGNTATRPVDNDSFAILSAMRWFSAFLLSAKQRPFHPVRVCLRLDSRQRLDDPLSRRGRNGNAGSHHHFEMILIISTPGLKRYSYILGGEWDIRKRRPRQHFMKLNLVRLLLFATCLGFVRINAEAEEKKDEARFLSNIRQL